MIAEALQIFTSAAGGSIIGGLFGWLNKREDAKVRKQDQDHDFRMVGAKSHAGELLANAQAYVESQKTVSKVGGAIKSAFRPILTSVLMYMVYKILINLEIVTGGVQSLPVEMQVELYREIILNIISLTSTAVNWWFASRPTGVNKHA